MLGRRSLAGQALIEAWRDVPWFLGTHWWNWDTDPRFGGNGNTCLTPQQKPAEQVLRRAYGGSSTVRPFVPPGPPACPCIDT
jgi:hypothetical protein